MKRNHKKESAIREMAAAARLSIGDIYCYDRLGSTMDAAFAHAAASLKNRTVFFTDEQYEGRGRFGRHWYSTEDDLMFSIVLKEFNLEVPHSMLSALAVFRAFKKYTHDVRLKWVNDVLWKDGRKVAGILSEEKNDRTVIGIGVNLNSKVLPPEVSAIATSYRIETGKTIPKEQFLLDVIGKLFTLLDKVEKGRISNVLMEWEKCSKMKGRSARVTQENVEHSGLVQGIDRQSGALILLTEQGELTFYDGHVVFEGRTDEPRS